MCKISQLAEKNTGQLAIRRAYGTSALFFIIRAYRTTVDLFNGIGTASLLNNTSSVLKELYHLYTLFDYKLTPSILFLNFFKNQRL